MPSDAPRPEDPRNDPGIERALDWVRLSEHAAPGFKRSLRAEAALYRAIEEWHRKGLARLREDRDRLDWLEARSTQIDYSPDELEPLRVIYEITGNINDRLWTKVAEGDTVRDAIDRARGPMSADPREAARGDALAAAREKIAQLVTDAERWQWGDNLPAPIPTNRFTVGEFRAIAAALGAVPAPEPTPSDWRTEHDAGARVELERQLAVPAVPAPTPVSPQDVERIARATLQ